MYIILPKKKDKIILSIHYYREHGRIYVNFKGNNVYSI